MQTHASWLLLRYALDEEEKGGLGYVRVVWWCDETNEASARAAGRLGLRREGVLVSETLTMEGRGVGTRESGRLLTIFFWGNRPFLRVCVCVRVCRDGAT